MVQVVFGIVVVLILAVVTFILYKVRKNERPDLEYYNKMSIEYLLSIIKIEAAEITKDDDMILTNDINFEAIVRNKRKADNALTNCIYGIPADVEFVKALIRDILQRELPSMEAVSEVIDFTELDSLEPMVKFETLLYKLHAKPGSKVIQMLNEKYALHALRDVDDGYSTHKRRCFDYKMLDSIFALEVKPNGVTYAEALDILSTILFSKFKGFGCISTLLSLGIDGLNFGTSGTIRYEIEGKFDAPYRATNSVWVQIEGKWIHFSFLDFYITGEMKRVCSQLVSWGSSSPMNEKHSYKVSELPDGSRITAIGPPTGECFACFIRKFTLSSYTKKELFDKPNVHNSELLCDLLGFLMKAHETTPFTGDQNMGKTSTMKAVIEDVQDLNIRVLEISFELALREIYNGINVFTMKPSDYVSGANLQDLMKKMDSGMSMVGEVAEDIIAARMIQFTLVGTPFTIFSHHGKNDAGLIYGLTNSLVASGEYRDHNVAMSTVLDAIKHNVHNGMVNNTRCVEYVSEIVKEEVIQSYPELQELLDKANYYYGKNGNEVAKAMLAYTELTREYYARCTDRVKFKSRKIIVFNPDNNTYEPSGWYTPTTFERMLKNLKPDDREAFIAFYEKNWRCRGL